jgi:hypothetical protein
MKNSLAGEDVVTVTRVADFYNMKIGDQIFVSNPSKDSKGKIFVFDANLGGLLGFENFKDATKAFDHVFLGNIEVGGEFAKKLFWSRYKAFLEILDVEYDKDKKIQNFTLIVAKP